MRATLVTAPATELIETAEAKRYLGIGFTAQDTLVDELIPLAREAAERYTRRAFISQVWDFTLERWPNVTTEKETTIYLPPGTAVASVKYYDVDGAQQTLVADTDYRAYPNVENSMRVGLLADVSWPALENGRLEPITIQATIGYGAAVADVPEGLALGYRYMLADVWEHRSSYVPGQSVAKLPLSATALLSRYQLPQWGWMP